MRPFLASLRITDLAVIVDDAQAHRPAIIDQSASYHKQREAAIESQRLETRRSDEEKKLKAAELYKDKIGKRREEKKKAIETTVTGDVTTSSFEVLVPDLPPGATTLPVSYTHL